MLRHDRRKRSGVNINVVHRQATKSSSADSSCKRTGKALIDVCRGLCQWGVAWNELYSKWIEPHRLHSTDKASDLAIGAAKVTRIDAIRGDIQMAIVVLARL